MLNAGAEADISVAKRLFAGIGEGMSLFVRKLGMKLFANHGAVSIQAQNDRMELLARQAVDIVSTENEIHITAKKAIVINAGGSYLRMDQHSIEYGTQGDYLIKSPHYEYRGPASLDPAVHILPAVSSGKYRGILELIDQHKKPIPDRFYKVVSPSGVVLASGVTDGSGKSIEVVSHEGANATAYIGEGGWTISEVEISTDDECGCC